MAARLSPVSGAAQFGSRGWFRVDARLLDCRHVMRPRMSLDKCGLSFSRRRVFARSCVKI